MSAETQKVDVLAVMGRVAEFGVSAPEWHAMPAARAAVAELIEAAGLRVDYINRSWYVLHAGGAAWSSVGHASEIDARMEAAEALREALARVGGAA